MPGWSGALLPRQVPVAIREQSDRKFVSQCIHARSDISEPRLTAAHAGSQALLPCNWTSLHVLNAFLDAKGSRQGLRHQGRHASRRPTGRLERHCAVPGHGTPADALRRASPRLRTPGSGRHPVMALLRHLWLDARGHATPQPQSKARAKAPPVRLWLDEGFEARPVAIQDAGGQQSQRQQRPAVSFGNVRWMTRFWRKRRLEVQGRGGRGPGLCLDSVDELEAAESFARRGFRLEREGGTSGVVLLHQTPPGRLPQSKLRTHVIGWCLHPCNAPGRPACQGRGRCWQPSLLATSTTPTTGQWRGAIARTTAARATAPRRASEDARTPEAAGCEQAWTPTAPE